MLFTLCLDGTAKTSVAPQKQYDNVRRDSIDRILSRKAEKIAPWVRLASRPFDITNGLKGRHLSIWPSHGRYYNFKTSKWEWQRPQLYGTVEDLFTQSIVIPYLLPMLENAGANIFVPRERDWQENEYIVDNDLALSGFMQHDGMFKWQKAPRAGFGIHRGNYHDGDRPFTEGSALCVQSVTNGNVSKALYKPNIQESGRYAVYVSYQTVDNSVDDAEYIVVHQGKKTIYRVNQQMGSGTWVYLGTFDFDAHASFENYVMVTNNSSRPGRIVTTDAVRFGAGMGNFERNGKTSGVPKAMECARYWVQFAGGPRAAICSKGSSDDYGDDLNCRSLMSNWISYGSPYNPSEHGTKGKGSEECETVTIAESAAKTYLESIDYEHLDSIGKQKADSTAKAISDSITHIPVQVINVARGDVPTGHVPIELQLGVHSDAGYSEDFKTHTGTLSICTMDFNSRLLTSGQERSESFDLACELLYGVSRDIRKVYGDWVTREVFDRNYSETRLPAQPSAILEMLAHQNFADMRLGNDPNFKFTMARAIYKVLLRRLCKQHQMKAVVEPLAPNSFSAASMKSNVLTLTWAETKDSIEESAKPTGYVLYTRVGDMGWDNGTVVKGTEHKMVLRPDKLYRFKVTAINAGGESFPTEELVAMYRTGATKSALIVNGFHRLSSPEVVFNDSIAGFDLNADIGVSYGKTPVWCGLQQVYDRSKVGKGRETGTTDSSLIGRFIAGNDFNYVYDHADAIAQDKSWHIVSMSSECMEGNCDLSQFTMVDVLLGNEKDDHHSLKPYKTFSPSMQEALTNYTAKGGKIFASGSYIASDMQSAEEKAFVNKVLKIDYAGIDRDSLALRTDSLTDNITFSNTPTSVYRHVNSKHYASVSSDIITPANKGAATIMTYPSGQSAAVKSQDTVILGFPFECIKSRKDRIAIMLQIMDYLTIKNNK